jgi:hypothetical protein
MRAIEFSVVAFGFGALLASQMLKWRFYSFDER